MLRHHTVSGLHGARSLASRTLLAMPRAAACAHSGIALPSPAAAAAQPHRYFAVKVSKDAKKGGAKDTKKDDAKKKKKKKGGPPTKGADAPGKSADLSVLEQLLEQQLTAPEPAETRTPAELALDNEYAKEYSKRCMLSHVAHQTAQVAFLRSRWQAVNALPVPLRTEALKEDMTPWPKNFQPIPWTPREYVKRFGPKAAAGTTGDKK